MSEWVDIVAYATLIVAVWGWLPAWSSRLAIPVIADRNPDWLADHPERGRRLVEGRWFRWSCLLWGLASLLTLLLFQFDAWPQQLAFLRVAPKWEALKDLNSTLFIAGLVYVTACAVLFFRWLDANVPLSSRRQATLERRSLHDYVPRPLRYAVCAAIVLHLATWAVVCVTGRYATAAFWGAMAFQFVLSGVFLLFVVTAVRRRPGAMDRILGPGYRRTEVRVAFAAQLLPLPKRHRQTLRAGRGDCLSESRSLHAPRARIARRVPCRGPCQVWSAKGAGVIALAAIGNVGWRRRSRRLRGDDPGSGPGVAARDLGRRDPKNTGAESRHIPSQSWESRRNC